MPKIIEREVKLFVAGDFPDKGLSVDEAMIDGWIAKSPAEIPFNIAHLDLEQNPLTFLPQSIKPFISGLVRRGKELFGRLAILEELNKLIELTGKFGVSVGLSEGAASVEEVSWTPWPRVASAQIFHSKPAYVFRTDAAFAGEVSLTEQERCVRDAFYAKFAPADGCGPHPWVREVFEDHVIYEANGGIFRRNYSADGEAISFSDEATAVRIQYVPKEETKMADEPTKTDVKPTGDAAVQFADLQKRIDAVEAENKALAAKNKELEEKQSGESAKFQRERDEHMLDKLIELGKILPAHKSVLIGFSEMGGTVKLTFSDKEEPVEQRPMDAIVKFFMDFDVQAVAAISAPTTRTVSNSEGEYKFSEEQEKQVERHIREHMPEATNEEKDAYRASQRRFFASMREGK